MNKSRQTALTSTIVAVGAASRIVLGEVALASPTPLFGVMIKIGLTETLTIANGLALGATAGFVTGVLIILVSDLFILPGVWTPFIALIIGLLGFLAGISRRTFRVEASLDFAFLAVLLTVLSEFLQNLWVSVFYNVSISATMLAGFPSLLSALVNNVVLLSLAGPRVVKLIHRSAQNLSSEAFPQ